MAGLGRSLLLDDSGIFMQSLNPQRCLPGFSVGTGLSDVLLGVLTIVPYSQIGWETLFSTVRKATQMPGRCEP